MVSDCWQSYSATAVPSRVAIYTWAGRACDYAEAARAENMIQGGEKEFMTESIGQLPQSSLFRIPVHSCESGPVGAQCHLVRRWWLPAYRVHPVPRPRSRANNYPAKGSLAC